MQDQRIFNRPAQGRPDDSARRKSPLRHIDLTMLFAVLSLTSIGLLAIYSATRRGVADSGDPYEFVKRQAVFLGIAVGLFVGTMLIDYRVLRAVAPVLYGVGILVLLIALSPLGERVAGAQRWINLGFFRLQPSEVMKIVMIVALAAWFGDEKSEPSTSRLLGALGLSAIPLGLIFVQPDLGTLMVLGVALFAVLMAAGVKARWLVILLLAASVSFVGAMQLGVIKDYQVARLTAFLDPEADPQRAGYNLSQSKIAIGSGGLNGKGLYEGTQTNLRYVPEQHTDFIFTVIGEEGGFVASAVVLGLYALLLWRCFRAAMLSKDLFGTMLAGGVGAMFTFQASVNIGMTVGIMPITGIPLPFVSYGGTALVMSFVAIGLVMNVHMRRFV